MSSSCFRQTLITNVAPMPLMDDSRICGISSPSFSVPPVPLKNEWTLSSEYHLKNIAFSRGSLEAHEQIGRFQEGHLTDTKYILPGYDETPRRMEGTNHLQWQASASDLSYGVLGEKSPTGNVWDMLVGLLGTEQGKNFINTSERLSASPSYESQFLINAMARCYQEVSGRKSLKETNMPTEGENQMSVPREDFHESKRYTNLAVNDADKQTCKHNFPLTRNELQFVPLHKEKINDCPQCISECLVLVAPKKELYTPQRSETEPDSKSGTLCKVSNHTESVKMYKAAQSFSKSSVLSELRMKNPPTSSLLTKSMQQHYKKSNSGVPRSKRKGLGMSKQRGRLTKKKSETVTLQGRSKSTFSDYAQASEFPKDIIEHKPQGTPLAYPAVNYVQSVENEHFIQDSVVQASKTLDGASLKKGKTLTTQDYNESQDVFMWTDTLTKFLNPLSDCSRLHSVLMSSQGSENGVSNTMVIEFNVHPSLSVEEEPSFDSNKTATVVRHVRNTNQNQCFTGLFLSGQVPELPISELACTNMSKVMELREDKGEANAMKSLTNGSETSDDKKLQVTELSYKISKLTQPKIAEVWEEKDAANVTKFLTNGSESLEDENLQVPELSNLPKLAQAKMAELWEDENIAKLTESSTNASESSEDKKSKETGTAAVGETRNLAGLEVDCVSCVPSNKSEKSHEGWSVNSLALVCPSGIQQKFNESATTQEEDFPPEQQLKVLLHASCCRLLKCTMDSCAEAKQLLKHCSWCREEALCPVPHCSGSRNLLKHWNTCKVFHCPLCSSLRQCYGHSKVSIKGTPTTRSYSSNSNKRIRCAPYRASKSSRNVADTFTSNRMSKITVRNGSLPTAFPKSCEAAVPPKRVTASEGQFLFVDKCKSPKSNQCDLQENRRCRTQCVHGPCSDVSQTGWDFPFGSNDLGENLDHIFWSDSSGEDIHQETATEFASKSIGEGPKLAAGFTMLAEHLRDRLDCLLHGVACEEPDYKALQECTVKHCSIMKSFVMHMSSCSEFQVCSNVICLLFSPLFLHWKKCCGPCAVCGPVNMKYNKKKLLKKLPSAIVNGEIISEEAVFDRHRETDHVWRQGTSKVAAPYYLRKYMMEKQLSIPAVYSGCILLSAGSKKAQETAVSYAGNTWDQLTGIDTSQQRLLENMGKPDVVNSVGFIESHTEQRSSLPHSGHNESNDIGNRSMQDLRNAISLYNFHSLESKYMG